jgi:hypothetical protein
MLQAERTGVLDPIMSFNFFNLVTHSTMGFTQPLREMSTRNRKKYFLRLERSRLQIRTLKEEIRRYSSPHRTAKRPSSEPHGATRQQAIAEIPAK